MHLTKNQKIFLIISLFCIYALAVLIQSTLIIKGDISWQMKLAGIVLAGGDYVKDFFEINPPLSIYLYMPAVEIQHYFSLSAFASIQIYIILLASFSLILCYPLMKKFFLIQHNLIGMTFILSLAFAYLVMPFTEFAQRENLLIIFTMPYFLLVAARLNHQPVSPFLAAVTGLAAALGFAIKPFFYLAFALVELYYLFSQPRNWRQLFAWIRIETVCIILFALLYLLLIAIFYQSYLNVIVPLATRYYYKTFGYPWQLVLLSPIILYCYSCIVLYFILYKNNPYKPLSTILLLAFIGFLACYFGQQIPWYYHLYPALVMCLILNILLFCIIIYQPRYRFADFLFALTLGFIIFYYPAQFLIKYEKSGMEQKTTLMPLINYLETQQHQPIYFLSAKCAYFVSILEHANGQLASRFQFLSWMQHYFRIDLPQRTDNQQTQDEKYFTDMLAEDLNHFKPKLIFVDRFPYETFLGTKMSLDYIGILTKNKNFRAAWEHYHYLKSLRSKDDYDFDVYQRR